MSLAKHVPAISSPIGGSKVFDGVRVAVDMNNPNYEEGGVSRPNGWGRNHAVYGTDWQHSDYGVIRGPWNFYGGMSAGFLFNPQPNDVNLEDDETARLARLHYKQYRENAR